jgi:hypothetical protein
MVVRCPADAKPEVLEKCAALNRSSSNFHYTMDIPVLSSTSDVWYRNVYCAICNEDADNLVRLTYSLECERNYTKEKASLKLADVTISALVFRIVSGKVKSRPPMRRVM